MNAPGDGCEVRTGIGCWHTASPRFSFCGGDARALVRFDAIVTHTPAQTFYELERLKVCAEHLPAFTGLSGVRVERLRAARRKVTT